MLELKSMNQSIYNNYIKNVKQQYVQELAKSRGIDFDEAIQLTNKEFDGLLPDGLKSKNQYLYTIINDTNKNIGIIWFSSESNHGDNEAFLFDIEIKKAYRGKGYGRKAMNILELKIKEMNIFTIGLHVFLHNEIACSLYNKIGYKEVKRGKAGVILKKTLKNIS